MLRAGVNKIKNKSCRFRDFELSLLFLLPVQRLEDCQKCCSAGNCLHLMEQWELIISYSIHTKCESQSLIQVFIC